VTSLYSSLSHSPFTHDTLMHSFVILVREKQNQEDDDEDEEEEDADKGH
jgi:hypothetical protein